MKQAGNNVRMVTNAEGLGWAIFLPANFTAEHEWGIKRLLATLNIDPEGKMIEGRSMKAPAELASVTGKVTKNYYIEENGKHTRKKISSTVTFVCTDAENLKDARYREQDVARYNHTDDFTGAWDGYNFKIAGWSKEANAFLDEIVAAAAKGDLTIFLGSPKEEARNPFSRNGLVIAIRSRMPQEAIDEINSEDADKIALTEAAKKTGIRQKIEDNAAKLSSWNMRPYHALSPAWVEGFKNLVGREGKPSDQTKHPVIFYLNPSEQGWFTVEELEQWIEGKGPIIKVDKAA